MLSQVLLYCWSNYYYLSELSAFHHRKPPYLHTSAMEQLPPLQVPDIAYAYSAPNFWFEAFSSNNSWLIDTSLATLLVVHH